MKITKRQLRNIIKEAARGSVRVNAGMQEVDFVEFGNMAQKYGLEVFARRTSRDSGHNEVFFDTPKGRFTLKHIRNNNRFFLNYDFKPSDGSKPIKNRSIFSKKEMYEVVESYIID